MKRVAIVGLGLVGRQRVAAVEDLRQRGRAVELCGTFDPKDPGDCASLEDVIARRPDLVVIATPHDVAPKLAAQCLEAGCGVLLEKPMGRTLEEAHRLRSVARAPLWIGFNYRFFRGVAAAIADLRDGVFGRLISATMVLGHGGSPDLRGSWKFDPVRAGGGCLIDPGIHLLDLIGEMPDAASIRVRDVHTWRGFWDTGIEEEAHALFGCGDATVNLQVSVVRWRSTFRLEVHGTEGYGVVTGRHRSYGDQRYVRGRRWGWQDGGTQESSEETVGVWPHDTSFADELDALLFDAPCALRPATADDGLRAMTLLDDCLRRAEAP